MQILANSKDLGINSFFEPSETFHFYISLKESHEISSDYLSLSHKLKAANHFQPSVNAGCLKNLLMITIVKFDSSAFWSINVQFEN